MSAFSTRPGRPPSASKSILSHLGSGFAGAHDARTKKARWKTVSPRVVLLPLSTTLFSTRRTEVVPRPAYDDDDLPFFLLVIITWPPLLLFFKKKKKRKVEKTPVFKATRVWVVFSLLSCANHATTLRRFDATAAAGGIGPTTLLWACLPRLPIVSVPRRRLTYPRPLGALSSSSNVDSLSPESSSSRSSRSKSEEFSGDGDGSF